MPYHSSFHDSGLALPEDKEGGRVMMVGSGAKRMETQDERQRSDRLTVSKVAVKRHKAQEHGYVPRCGGCVVVRLLGASTQMTAFHQ